MKKDSRCIVFEDRGAKGLEPLTRALATQEIRLGPETVAERLERLLRSPITDFQVRPELAAVVAARERRAVNRKVRAGDLLVNARWIPEGRVVIPREPHAAYCDGDVAHARLDGLAEDDGSAPAEDDFAAMLTLGVAHLPRITAKGRMIRHPWDIVASLRTDLTESVTARRGKRSPRARRGVTIVKPARTFVAADCAFQGPCTLDATDGPILIERGAGIGAYVVIEGPAYIGRGSRINPHAWLHGANAIGPRCKLGGEIDGCLFQGFSNKQHAGFLGHAWVGSWVNLGAGTTNSDLKNTYGTVRVRRGGDAIDTGQMFFGAVIADHVKTGIGTLLPTGAVLDFAAVAATGGLLPAYLPPFAWATRDLVGNGDPHKLLGVARRMMSRRGVEMSDPEATLFLKLAAGLTARR